jgi:endonuclease YncB( thermonuclease family)
MAYRRRPLWRTVVDALIFVALLTAAVLVLDRFNMIDLGTGNARVKDGDSLVLNGNDIRLHGIDAPELHQTCGSPEGEYPCGRLARDALRDLTRNQVISCTSAETDRYGRAVAVCHAGETEINREMVRQGWAVAYFRHSTAYARAQKEAKAAKRGIWRGRFEMPENFRERTRPVGADLGE